MDKFSFRDCKILWNKKFRTPKRDKVALRADLETMSNIIEEAMTYTKDKVLKENRETVIRYWLNTKTHVSYYVDIFYEPGMDAWGFHIGNENGEGVGEVISGKWPFQQLLLDEDVEAEHES